MHPEPSPWATAVLRSLPDGVVVVDDHGRIAEVNDRLLETTARPRSEFVGAPVERLFAPAVGRMLADALERWRDEDVAPVRDGGLRLPLMTADGEVDADVRVVPDADGHVLVIRDLTPGADDIRSRLLDAVSTPVVDGIVLRSVAEAVGRSFPWDHVVLWAVAGGEPRALTVWQRDPERGSAFRAGTLAAAQGGPAGLVGHVVATGRDHQARSGEIAAEDRYRELPAPPTTVLLVPARYGTRTVGVVELVATEALDVGLWAASTADAVRLGVGQVLDRFEQRLRVEAAERRLALALDAGEFGVWTLDEQSGSAEWSDRMAEFHGVAVLQGAEETVFSAVIPDDRHQVVDALAAVRAEDGPRSVEYRVDGRFGIRWISTRLIRVDDNGSSFVAAVSSDRTEQKRTEIDQRRRRAVVEALRWVHEAIIAGEALADTAEAVAQSACGVLGADAGIVVHPVPGDLADARAWTVWGIDDPPPMPTDADLPAGRFTDDRVSVVADVGQDAEFATVVHDAGLPVDHFVAGIVAPIRNSEQEIIGYLLFGSRHRGYFSAEDAELAASIATTTGVAIDNAMRHEQQRLAAMTFQHQLLPGADFDHDDLEVCVRYHPGREGVDVGGDWYDVIELGSRRVGLAVGDVCGHGLAAAAHMGQLRYSFRALVQAGNDPAEAFQVLNRLAIDELGTTVTMAYTEIDTVSGACTSWICGHLPPVIAAPDGTVRWVERPAGTGPMLGFLDEVSVAPARSTLERDETLLLYTDGLVERRGESIDVGLERLAGSFATPTSSMDDMCDRLYGDLADIGPDADDTALLAVRRR